MATWMTHLRIADNLLDRIPDLSPIEFIMGNLAPDSGVPNPDGSFSPAPLPSPPPPLGAPGWREAFSRAAPPPALCAGSPAGCAASFPGVVFEVLFQVHAQQFGLLCRRFQSVHVGCIRRHDLGKVLCLLHQPQQLVFHALPPFVLLWSGGTWQHSPPCRRPARVKPGGTAALAVGCPCGLCCCRAP